ncbi:uncharacterized protein [Diadema antillarum]|uniref:uncharacterized protein n=1 Tax=Diadema antillarum TaxID=105358 RepID=UPI003A8754A8
MAYQTDADGYSYRDKVSSDPVYMIHGEREIREVVSPVTQRIEDDLKIEKVTYKRNFKDKPNEEIAREILNMVNSLQKGDGRGIVMLSHQFCKVLKNNKILTQQFEEKILEDLSRPSVDHRIAWLLTEDDMMSKPIVSEVFSAEFVNRMRQIQPAVQSSTTPLDAEAIRKQWQGTDAEPPGDMDVSSQEETTLKVENVHIVHGGAKQAVREIGRELEDGFELEETIKYKLYHGIAADPGIIAKIVLSEVRAVIEKDGPNTLGVVVWCPKLLDMMVKSSDKGIFENLLINCGGGKVFVHLCLGVNEYVIKNEFQKLMGLGFVPIEVNEDGSIDLKNLVERIKVAWSMPVKVPTKPVALYSDAGDQQPSPKACQDEGEERQSSADRRSSHISEPRALASEEGCRRQYQDLGQGPVGTIVGNPCNQNEQGGRLLPSGFHSHSLQYHGAKSPGAPILPTQAAGASSGMCSSGEGRSKVITNDGGSWSGGPAEFAPNSDSLIERMMQQGQTLTNGGSPGDSFPQQMIHPGGNPALTGVGDSPNGSGMMYRQATSAQSSLGRSRYVADNVSLSMTSLPSSSVRPFGSHEPVTRQTDPTVEPVSGNNLNNTARITNQEGFHSLPSEHQMASHLGSDRSYLTSAPQRSKSIDPEGQNQRPTACKFPRRDNMDNVSSAVSGPSSQMLSYGSQAKDCAVPFPSSTTSSQFPLSFPTVTAGASIGDQQIHFSGLESIATNRLSGSRDPPIVQCSSESYNISNDHQPHYAVNTPSVNAFAQEDRRDFENLPNEEVPSNFRSRPAGTSVKNKDMGYEQSFTASEGKNLLSRDTINLEEEKKKEPADCTIAEMDNNCRKIMKYLLDPESATGMNWKDVAHHYRMDGMMIRYLEHKNKDHTEELLTWISQKWPWETCRQLKLVVKQCQRMDVVRKMEKFGY